MSWLRSLSARERGMGVALMLAIATAVAAVAVPAWGDSDDPGDPGSASLAGDVKSPSASAAEQDEIDGLTDCLRRHGAPLPAERPEGDELPAPIPRDDFEEAFQRAVAECGLSDPPPGSDPFPLSDEQISAWRARLEEFTDCMRSHGQNVGEPEVERDRIAIQLGDGAFSEDFLAAQRECGGPPV